MENKTINEVMNDANSIDITQPMENSYLPCHLWRMNCVKRAIMLFCVKLTQWGYEAYYGDTYFSAKMGGRHIYCQYNSLLHSYTYGVNGDNIERNHIMEIEITKDDFDRVFEELACGKNVGYYQYRIVENN